MEHKQIKKHDKMCVKTTINARLKKTNRAIIVIKEINRLTALVVNLMQIAVYRQH